MTESSQKSILGRGQKLSLGGNQSGHPNSRGFRLLDSISSITLTPEDSDSSIPLGRQP